MQTLDFLAVGDITTDSFIRLQDASVNCDINHHNCKICMAFGEKIPYEFVEDVHAVGNSPNASVSAARLGLSVAMVTDIGNDDTGKYCLDTLTREGVKTDYVTKHDGLPTNHHFVLWYEDERTILVKHTHFPYRFPEVPEPKWMYLSSIGANSEEYHDQIAKYLEAHPNTKLAFQPGTFQMRSGLEKMGRFYKRADIVAVNIDEARRILNNEHDIKDLLREMRALGSKTVFITDGRKGSYIYVEEEMWHIPIYPDARPPKERTGAGDASTSTFVAGLILGLSPTEAVRWGHTNSRSVVQEVGAQKGLLTRKQIEEELAKAPAEFKAERIA